MGEGTISVVGIRKIAVGSYNIAIRRCHLSYPCFTGAVLIINNKSNNIPL